MHGPSTSALRLAGLVATGLVYACAGTAVERDEAAADILDRDEFGEDIATKASTETGGVCSYVALEFAVRCETSTLFLSAIYDEVAAAAPETRDALVGQHLASLSVAPELPADWATARSALRPRVKSRYELSTYPLLMRLQGAAPHEAVGPGFTRLGEHLAVDLVYDLPQSMVPINDRRLASWGVTRAEATRVALENLRTAGPTVFEDAGSGVVSTHVGDAYDATRLLLVEHILALDLKGAPVALPSNRGLLAVTGSEDPQGLRRLADLAQEGTRQPRWITSLPLTWTGARWETWRPPEGDPLASRWRQLELLNRGQEYSDQRDLLRRLHKLDGVKIYLPDFGSIGDLATKTLTMAVIEKAVCLLPETDVVGFVGTSGEPALVRWDDLIRVLGDSASLEAGLYPPRWRIDGAQIGPHLAALEAAAVPMDQLGL